MCGIAGVIDLAGQRTIAPGIIRSMAQAIIHRGPDEDGFLEIPGIAFANRRLSIVGLSDGKQPIFNEDRTIATVFNGEFFEYQSIKSRLESKGHKFSTHCDTELIPHLYEDHQEGMLDHLQGQFGIAVWDSRQKRVILARDQFGICPLYYAKVQYDGSEWLLFDISNAINDLEWQPTTMVSDAVEITLDWYFGSSKRPGPLARSSM